jgi:hypothetical protein
MTEEQQPTDVYLVYVSEHYVTTCDMLLEIEQTAA